MTRFGDVQGRAGSSNPKDEQGEPSTCWRDAVNTSL